MDKLSVVIITFNEERNIRRCLDSVRDLADEIVVLDSFSTDGTRDICEASGVRFLQHEFDGHIEQKNRALVHCSHDLVLSLDADEALSPKLASSIRAVKQQGHHEVYSMNRLSNYCGKWIRHCGWYPDRKIRLFRKGSGKWGGVNPHDMFLPKEGKDVVWLKGDIHHYTYYTVQEHRRQAEKFSTIAAKSLHGMGRRSSTLKIIYKPLVKFIRNYIIKAGFLDGAAGLTICRTAAWETSMKYRKLKALHG